MALARIAQDDFSAGMLRGTAPDVQPGVGVYEALNGLFNDDGDLYRRGGSAYAGPSVGAPILWVWSGVLGGRSFEFAATATTLFASDGTPIGALANPVSGPVLVAAFEDALYLPTGDVIRYGGGRLTIEAWARPTSIDATAPLHLAVVAHRLVVGCLNRVAFSGPDTPETFAATDFHLLNAGTVVVGLFAISDTLLTFSNFGLWSVTNMAYDLTDAAGNVQQTLSLIAPGLSLVHESGLAPFNGAVIAPCIDQIYLVSPLSAPVPISNSIAPLWASYVLAGARPGGAKVFSGTLLLPVLDAAGQITTLLTCRLTRPVRGRVMYYPWSEFDGHAAAQRMFDVALTTDAPRLLGAGDDGHVSDMTGVFATSGVLIDADGTTYAFALETRDFPTGQGQPNHLRRVRLSYSAQGSGLIKASYCSDEGRVTWTDLGTQALTDGRNPLSWWLPQAARVRYVRVRFDTVDSVGLVLHRVELNARSAAHAR